MFRFVFTTLLMIGALACATPGTPTTSSGDRAIASKASGEIGPQALVREISERMFQIDEFKALREWGSKNGVRVWGAGGTATGLAVYVKQDLERERLKKAGKPSKYFDGRFSYNYFDVYRSTQDADIVIDGTEADAQSLEKFLRERFPTLQGSKEIWEVRLLNSPRGSGAGEKDPLLGFDFQNQNSDSFSTGMIEITDPPPSESRIRDLFDWSNQNDPRFLHDIATGKVTFYRNKNHGLTKRAKTGMNPEILSAIRALTKAFQYESELRPEDEIEIRRIIADFDPKAETSDYVTGQISKNGQKLYWHSPDVERAWNDLERLGLRKKLVEFGKNHGKGDLAVWLDREPLRTLPFGKSGATAAELGIDIVAHETNSFLAYENISRSIQGKPNVFISRKGAAKEAALYGDGFYTKIGRSGARSTGITIRFRLDPNAREGADFILADSFVVVRNARALRVIDESLNLTPVQYFKLLASGEITADDRGMLDKLRRKLKTAISNFTPEEDAEIAKIVAIALKKDHYLERKALRPVVSEWLTLPAALKHPKILEYIRAKTDREFAISQRLFFVLPDHKEWLKRSVTAANIDIFLTSIVSPQIGPRISDFDEWVDRAFELAGEATVAKNVLAKSGMETHPRYTEWMDRAIGDPLHHHHRGAAGVCAYVLSQPERRKHPQFETWVDRLIAIQNQRSNVAEYLLSTPEAIRHSKFSGWVSQTIASFPDETVDHVLRVPEVASHPEFSNWMKFILTHKPGASIKHTLVLPHVMKHSDFGIWMEQILNDRAFNWGPVDSRILTSPEAIAHPDHPKWVEKLTERHPPAVADLLSDPKNFNTLPRYSDWVDLMVAKHPEETVKKILRLPSITHHPKFVEWVERVRISKPEELIKFVLSKNTAVRVLPEFDRWLNEALISRPLHFFAFILDNSAFYDHPNFSKWVTQVIELGEDSSKILWKNSIFRKHPDFPKWVRAAIKKNPKQAAEGLLLHLKSEDIDAEPRLARWIVEAVRADPNLQIDTDLYSLTAKGQKNLFTQLCPELPVTTACLRKRRSRRLIEQDHCLELLNAYLK